MSLFVNNFVVNFQQQTIEPSDEQSMFVWLKRPIIPKGDSNFYSAPDVTQIGLSKFWTGV